MPEPFEDIVERTILAEWKQGESALSLLVQPRPRWMPRWMHRWLLCRLLYISASMQARWAKNRDKP